jgi:hypothetical protein
MLKMFNLPSSTTLHLHCIPEIAHGDAEGLLFPVISAQFQSPALIEFKSLTATIAGHVTFNITASTFPSTLRNLKTQRLGGDTVGNAGLVLSFDGLSKPGHSTELLKQACKMLPISNLESISMSVTHIIDINWAELFSCCTNVTTMQAIGHGTCNLVRALTAPTTTNAGPRKEGRKGKPDNRENTVEPASTVAHTHHAAIFPELKFLGLAELSISENRHNTGDLFDIFERGLQQRMAASGEPLKLLRLEDCDISTEHTNDLQKLVQDFDRSMCSDAYGQRLHDTGEVVFADHGTAQLDWDWDGLDDDTDSDDHSESDGW